ncbi:MAG: M42 family metallopeptidase [Clostridia bacterium]|nr:M42 family metallopeptidase [Clostridia bacterium]
MELLKQLLETLSVSGNEENLADLIEKEIAPYVDEIRRDVMGNLIAFKKGAGEAPKKMMLSAHMDEIGMIITHAEEDGYLRFANVGGLRIPFLVGQPVIFKNGVRGNVMYETKIDFSKLKLENLYIDIGAETAEEALSMVSIGDVCAPYGTLFELGEHRVCGKSMDDKVACYIQIEAIKKLKNTVYDTYFVFSTQEELGLRGAHTAAYAINPDYGVALDVTGVGDMHNMVSPNALKLGKGAAVKVRDSSIICSRLMVNFLKKVAKEKGIPYQMEVLMAGGTDAGAIHTTREGVITGGISIPTRNIHSPVEVADKRDIAACIDLIVEMLGTPFEG